jgi:hypothetical protein
MSLAREADRHARAEEAAAEARMALLTALGCAVGSLAAAVDALLCTLPGECATYMGPMWRDPWGPTPPGVGVTLQVRSLAGLCTAVACCFCVARSSLSGEGGSATPRCRRRPNRSSNLTLARARSPTTHLQPPRPASPPTPLSRKRSAGCDADDCGGGDHPQDIASDTPPPCPPKRRRLLRSLLGAVGPNLDASPPPSPGASSCSGQDEPGDAGPAGALTARPAGAVMLISRATARKTLRPLHQHRRG